MKFLMLILLFVSPSSALFASKKCTSNTFVFQPIPQYPSYCLPCWACCKFPTSFNTCPGYCDCTAIQANLTSFYEYYTYEDISSSSPVTRSHIETWLARFPNPPEFTSYILDSLLNYGDTWDISTFAKHIEHLHTTFPLCTRPPNPHQTPNTSLPGCPCMSTESPSSPFQCPKGFKCTTAAYAGIPSTLYNDPYGYILKALCIPCDLGDYCPNGTVSMKCPLGSFCPSPAIKLQCPPGTFSTFSPKSREASATPLPNPKWRVTSLWLINLSSVSKKNCIKAYRRDPPRHHPSPTTKSFFYP